MNPDKKAAAAVVLAALGYFVDLYDLILFSIVRVASLKDIGVSGEALLTEGVRLLNMQMIGMLIGGVLWGVLGDKRGRLSVLFGSIFLYSIANFANGYVHSVEAYAWLRLFAGIGLAGELGAGVTLVSELMTKENRGYGTMIIAGVGFLGGIMASLVGGLLHWRTAYILGGVMGFLLLGLRFGVYESGLFDQLKASGVERGNFLRLFADRERFTRYLCCILIGLPIWFTIGILITFSPELGKALGLAAAPEPAKSVLFYYIGTAFGDFASGFLSQKLRTRKAVVAGFLVLKAIAVAVYLGAARDSTAFLYGVCVVLGVATGYWAVFITIASEQFGTNIRATVTTSVPNFVRGATVPITLAFKSLKASIGVIGGASAVGAVCLILAFLALSRLEETYGKDLDYYE